jgi:hypothetical protein
METMLNVRGAVVENESQKATFELSRGFCLNGNHLMLRHDDDNDKTVERSIESVFMVMTSPPPHSPGSEL